MAKNPSVTLLRAMSIAAIALCLSAGATCNGGGDPNPGPNPDPVPTHEVVAQKELIITDLSVVEDGRANGPDGPWSFGGLVKAMSGTTDPSRFVVDWLTTWETDQSINGFTVKARPGIRSVIIDPWKARDGQPGVPDDQWNVNFANAPFRLLAIVNRLDLTAGSPTKVENAGEGRFVFGVLGSGGQPLPFTVIFEFEQVATNRAQLRGWAQQWHALGAMEFGASFNEALRRITDRFSGKDRAPQKPNGSPLNQLRTNEIALSFPGGWELREFRIDGGVLKTAPTLQSPSNSFQNSATLRQFVTDNEAEILDGEFRIPTRFNNAPFLAGSSLIAPPAGPGFKWVVPSPVNNEARHRIALGSCNGCHHLETGTQNFLHVANRAAGQQAALSGFLVGGPNGSDFEVEDQGVGGFTRKFNDLRDRAAILRDAAAEAGDIQLNSLRNARRFRVH
jgi:hypothetical protein